MAALHILNTTFMCSNFVVIIYLKDTLMSYHQPLFCQMTPNCINAVYGSVIRLTAAEQD